LAAAAASRALKRTGLSRLKDIDPAEPVRHRITRVIRETELFPFKPEAL
jgi:hypothetical protein